MTEILPPFLFPLTSTEGADDRLQWAASWLQVLSYIPFPARFPCSRGPGETGKEFTSNSGLLQLVAASAATEKIPVDPAEQRKTSEESTESE